MTTTDLNLVQNLPSARAYLDKRFPAMVKAQAGDRQAKDALAALDRATPLAVLKVARSILGDLVGLDDKDPRKQAFWGITEAIRVRVLEATREAREQQCRARDQQRQAQQRAQQRQR